MEREGSSFFPPWVPPTCHTKSVELLHHQSAERHAASRPPQHKDTESGCESQESATSQKRVTDHWKKISFQIIWPSDSAINITMPLQSTSMFSVYTAKIISLFLKQITKYFTIIGLRKQNHMHFFSKCEPYSPKITMSFWEHFLSQGAASWKCKCWVTVLSL